MPDLDALKSRVERAERHMEAAREARESQSAALVEMWRQIRDRFAAQEREIASYRAQVAALEDEHAALLAQVESLLEVIDRSLGRGVDETVPRIGAMAQALLDGEAQDDDIEIPEAPEHPAATAPRRQRAKRNVRDVIDRVEEARLTHPAAPDPDRDPAEADRDEIDDLRAELETLNHRLGAQRG